MRSRTTGLSTQDATHATSQGLLLLLFVLLLLLLPVAAALLLLFSCRQNIDICLFLSYSSKCQKLYFSMCSNVHQHIWIIENRKRFIDVSFLQNWHSPYLPHELGLCPFFDVFRSHQFPLIWSNPGPRGNSFSCADAVPDARDARRTQTNFIRELENETVFKRAVGLASVDKFP